LCGIVAACATVATEGFEWTKSGVAARRACTAVGVVARSGAAHAASADRHGFCSAERLRVNKQNCVSCACTAAAATASGSCRATPPAAAATTAADEFHLQHLGPCGFCPSAVGGEDLGVGELAG
jgi:hypothetical protein